LRHPACVSDLAEITEGSFKELIVDEPQSKKIRKVVFCSGKIYYDLKERQEKEEKKDVLIARVEQLYPIPLKQMQAVIDKYPDSEIVWLQEEPKNMGAWQFLVGRLFGVLPKVKGIYRKNSASPATGFKKNHLKEQDYLLTEALK